MNTLKILASGIECVNCASSVEKALKNVSGVESASGPFGKRGDGLL